MEQESVSVQLATVTEQIAGLNKRFEVVEKKIDGLVKLTTAVAELDVHRENEIKEREVLWEKIREVTLWRSEHERKEGEKYLHIVEVLEKNSKAFTQACNLVEKKVDSWINKFKGAFWILGMLWVIFQALGVWYFSSTMNGLAQLQTRLSSVETEQIVEKEIRRRNLVVESNQ